MLDVLDNFVSCLLKTFEKKFQNVCCKVQVAAKKKFPCSCPDKAVLKFDVVNVCIYKANQIYF